MNLREAVELYIESFGLDDMPESSDAKDYMIAYSREAQEIRNRPALLVIYERNQ